MKGRSKFHDAVKTILFMVILTLVSISAVSGLHLLTRGRVELNESLFVKEGIMRAVNVEVPDTPADVERWYTSQVSPQPDAADPDYFLVTPTEPGTVPFYVFRVSEKGLWGTIMAVVALRNDLETIEGASFLSHNETPGLGARISEEWFTAQLAGKRAPLRLVPEKTRSDDPREMDAITGATITSEAARKMLNDTVRYAPGKVAGGGADG